MLPPDHCDRTYDTEHRITYQQRTDLVWHFLDPVKCSNVVKGVNGWRQPTVQAEYLSQSSNIDKSTDKISMNVPLYLFIFHFDALTLLVGKQKGIWPVESLVLVCWW